MQIMSCLFLHRDDFTSYADVCFREFGDRVSHWTTLNEPNILAFGGYDAGIFPPGRCSYPFGRNCPRGDSVFEPYIVAHNCLLAHSSVFALYKRKYQVLLSLTFFWMCPLNNQIKQYNTRTCSCQDMTLISLDRPDILVQNKSNKSPKFLRGSM